MPLSPETLELLALVAFNARKQALINLIDSSLMSMEWDQLEDEDKEIYRREVAAVINVYEEIN